MPNQLQIIKTTLNMFQSARLQLTLWFVFTTMIISSLFSLVIYQLVSWEIQRGFSKIEHRYTSGGVSINFVEPIRPELYETEFNEAKKRVGNRLILANEIIFVAAALGGYFLAGKTLSPIEESHEKQKQFIADASHELKTPLTAIHTSIEVALRDKKLTLKSAKNTLIETLTDINNLENLTRNLISLSHIQAGSKALIHSPVDLDELIRSVARKLKPLATKKNQELQLQLEPIIINADESKITELITILLDNAIKYSHPKKPIEITLSRSRYKANISIKDQGIGIESKDLPLIFERFYRTDTSRSKANFSGYGLGLCLAKQIVDLHQGSIKVSSKPGIGSTFTVSLPLNLS